MVHDLLYIDGGTPPPGSHFGGYYVRGLVVIYSNTSTHPRYRGDLLASFAHEIAHAHQDALIEVDGSGHDFGDWMRTPEGVAFEKARKKDWEEFGKTNYDTIPGLEAPWENAAQTCVLYWSDESWGREILGYTVLETDAPYRFKWAEEWLTKR